MSERDPIRDLENFGTGGVPVTPLSPAEVRRLGDRRRTRRNAVVAAGTVAAIAAIATPLAFLGGGSGEPAPTPPATSSSGLTQIPRDFPLDRGAFIWEGGGSEGRVLGPGPDVDISRAAPCGVDALRSDNTLDRLGYETTAPEFADRRELLLFDDERVAEEAISAARRAVEDCPTETLDDGIKLTWQTDTADTGQDSVTFSQGVAGQVRGGATYQYTRVGRAVLVIEWAGEGGGDVAEQTAITLQIAPAMCIFSTSPCSAGSSSSATGSSTATAEPPAPTGTKREIADDFPLDEGFPTQSERGEKGYLGPNRTIEPLAIEACGSPLPDPAHQDRLLARYESAEDYRTRQLTTYVDAEAAVAASRAFVEAFGDCPTEPHSDGYVSERNVQELSLGGESWALLDRSTMGGGATPFGATVLVVRVGRAVVIEEQTGHAGYPGPEGVAELGDRLSAPIAAMCAFTAAGC
jgi:hypothetical protein